MAETDVLHLFRSLYVRFPTVEYWQYLLWHIKVSILEKWGSCYVLTFWEFYGFSPLDTPH